MSRRDELLDIARNLRQYLQWQAAPLSGTAPSPASERDRWEAAQAARQRAALATSLADPEPVPPPRPPATAPSAPVRPSAAPLWENEAFSRGPRKTFQPDPAPRAETLDGIRKDLGDCQRCALGRTRTHIVFGVGSAKARLMFVGEAPGFHEDKQGEPFVGKAGELLDKMIGAMTLSRDEVYIANVLKCRPPENRDPAPDEVAKCSPFLERQIATIQPEVIVALGKFAANLLSGHQGSLNGVRGKWQSYKGIPLMPTFHPAYLLRNPADKAAAWADLKLVMQRLDLEIPEKYR